MKNFHNLFSIGLFSSIFFIPQSKADFDTWGYSTSPGTSTGSKFYRIDSTTGNATLVSEECDFQDFYGYCYQVSDVKYNDTTGKLEYKQTENRDGNGPFENNFTVQKWYSYDLSTGEKSEIDSPWTSNYTNTGALPKIYKSSDGTVRVQVGSDKLVTKNTDGSIQIGGDTNDIDITGEGLNVDGNPLITKKDNGEIHIGKNSLITTSEEETLSDGTKVQPLYAKDADGNKIPINIDGSKLLIDGVEVQTGNNTQVTTNKNNISTNTTNISTNTSNISTNKANIKNLGEGVAGSTALTAALSALPQTSKESKFSCGVGTGAYSSRYAVGFGCASKVNERVDINAGGSYVFGGSKSYGGGTLDSGVVKAGFVFKLGELNKPTQISFQDKKLIDKKISNLIKDNQNLKEKNDEIITQNQKLLARLEKLENIALKFQSNSEMISVATKD